AVERDQPRVEGIEAEAARRTIEPLTVDPLDPTNDHVTGPRAQAQRAIEQLPAIVVSSAELADDDVDIVLLEAGELRRRIERNAPAVDACKAAAELPGPLEDFLVETLAAAYHRGDELTPPAADVLTQSIRDLCACLRMDRAIAARAVLRADLRI